MLPFVLFTLLIWIVCKPWERILTIFHLCMMQIYRKLMPIGYLAATLNYI